MWWAALVWLLVTWAIAEWVEWGSTMPGSTRFNALSTLVVAAAWPVSLPIAAARTIKDLRRK